MVNNNSPLDQSEMIKKHNKRVRRQKKVIELTINDVWVVLNNGRVELNNDYIIKLK